MQQFISILGTISQVTLTLDPVPHVLKINVIFGNFTIFVTVEQVSFETTASRNIEEKQRITHMKEVSFRCMQSVCHSIDVSKLAPSFEKVRCGYLNYAGTSVMKKPRAHHRPHSRQTSLEFQPRSL